MTDMQTASIVRTSRNDQDQTRAVDIAVQVAQYRVTLLQGGVPEALANQLTFRFNEYVLSERIRTPAEVGRGGQ